MIIDGDNVTDWGVIVEDRNPSRSAASIQHIIQGAPGAWRRNRLGMNAPDPLEIRVVGHVFGALPNGGTLAQLRANIDEFKYRVRPNTELAIRWSDQINDSPIRENLGFRQSLIIEDIAPGWMTEGVRFSLNIICPDPFAREATLQSDTDNSALPNVITPTIGTAPMPVIITLTGNTASPLVDPVLHYRDGSDTDIVTLSLNDTLDSTETVVIDTEFFTAVKNGSTNVGGLISGSYFDVDPGDGDKYAGSPTYPDIYLTATSGAVDLFKVEWKRRYW